MLYSRAKAACIWSACCGLRCVFVAEWLSFRHIPCLIVAGHTVHFEAIPAVTSNAYLGAALLALAILFLARMLWPGLLHFHGDPFSPGAVDLQASLQMPEAWHTLTHHPAQEVAEAPDQCIQTNASPSKALYISGEMQHKNNYPDCHNCQHCWPMTLAGPRIVSVTPQNCTL